jgi:hypothetical protein
MTSPRTSVAAQLRPGAVRTATPFLVGWLVSFLSRQGLDINDDNAAYLIGAVGGYLYFLVARFLEVTVSEKWKYVLGLGLAGGSLPVYVEPPASTGVVVPDEPLADDLGAGELRLIALIAAGVIVGLFLWALLTRVA